MENKFEKYIQDLQGDVIKNMFIYADRIADLHSALSSPRGNYYRKKLLGTLTKPYTDDEVMKFSEKFGVKEYKRHVHKFIKYGLVSKREIDSSPRNYTYMRTYNGEDAVNKTRELERKISLDKAKKIYQACLGENSIRLFIKIYGLPKDVKNGDITYSPIEIGQISSFLPRTIEGMAATDKLDEAGLVSYLDDGKIHVNPRRSTAFYQYLKDLYWLLANIDRSINESKDNT
ncbi:MAG: hypothetical protein ABIG60_05325 [Patescibacteria group bacterium]